MFKIQSRKKSKKLNSQKASKKPQDFFRARLIYRIEVVFFKLRSCDQSDLFGREFFSLSIPWKLRSLGPGILLGINCEVLTKKKNRWGIPEKRFCVNRIPAQVGLILPLEFQSFSSRKKNRNLQIRARSRAKNQLWWCNDLLSASVVNTERYRLVLDKNKEQILRSCCV